MFTRLEITIMKSILTACIRLNPLVLSGILRILYYDGRSNYGSKNLTLIIVETKPLPSNDMNIKL